MKRPLVWGTCFYIGGILLGNIISSDISFFLFLSFFLLIILFLFVFKYHWLGFSFFLVFFFLGFFRMYTLNRSDKDCYFDELSSYVQQNTVVGTVEKIQQDSKQEYSIIYIQVHSSSLQKIKEIPKNKKFSICVQLYTEEAINIQPQDIIGFQGKLKKLKIPRNPGGFHQKRYGHLKGFDFICYGHITYHKSIHSFSFSRRLQKINKRFQNVYDTLLPSTQAGIVKAMVLGDQQSLEQDTKDLYKKAGISHILAISGLHISIIGFLLFHILQRIKISKRVTAVLTIIFLISYSFFTGNSVSTMRAVIMMSCILGGYIFFRTSDPYTSVAFSILLLLYKQPLYLWDIGFQLSYSAVIGILTFSPVIDQFYFIPSWIRSGFVASLSASLATYPIIAYHFYYIPVYGVLLNMIIVPFVLILVFFSGLAGIIGMFSIFLGRFMIGIVYYILYCYEVFAHVTIQLPKSYLLVGSPSLFMMILYYIIFLVTVWYFSKPIQNRKSYKKVYTYSFSFIGSILIGYIVSPKPLEVVFLDVGQGDCMVIHTPTNQHFLIDGGGIFLREEGQANTGKRIIQPYLEYKGIEKINGAWITHPHADHIIGLIELMDEVPIEQFFVSTGTLKNHSLYRELLQKANQYQIPIYFFKERNQIRVGDLIFTCLFDGHGQVLQEIDNWNLISLVVHLQYQDISFLFTGDMEKEIEEYIVKQYPSFVKNSVFLKVPHHGSNTSSTELLLDQIQSIGAVISSGENNIYGHPHPEIVKRYQERNISLYLTQEEGAIMVKTYGKGMRIYSFVGQRKEKWYGKTQK